MIRHFTQFILKRSRLPDLVLNQRHFQVHLIKEISLIHNNCLHYSVQLLGNPEVPLVKKIPLPDVSNYPHITNIIQTAEEFGITENEVKILLKHQPDLMNTSASSWMTVLETLSDANFTKEDILKILVNYPQVLSIKKHDFSSNIEAWLSIKLNRELNIQILTTHPQFLKVSASYLTKRISQLQGLFESKNRVGKLLLAAPNVLEENEDILLDKINYLNDLCMDPSDVAASGVLAHSALRIKARHEFLIRAGVYKVPQKDFKMSLSKNPKLEKIVNTSDFEFATKIAKLTKFEYVVFLEMFEKELKETHSGYNSD